jgi:hypothetical protein
MSNKPSRVGFGSIIISFHAASDRVADQPHHHLNMLLSTASLMDGFGTHGLFFLVCMLDLPLVVIYATPLRKCDLSRWPFVLYSLVLYSWSDRSGHAQAPNPISVKYILLQYILAHRRADAATRLVQQYAWSAARSTPGDAVSPANDKDQHKTRLWNIVFFLFWTDCCASHGEMPVFFFLSFSQLPYWLLRTIANSVIGVFY